MIESSRGQLWDSIDLKTLTDQSLRHFETRYREAPAKLFDFISGCGLSLEGKRVADVGCGDGVMALGLAHKGNPAELVGFDPNPTRTDLLIEMARTQGVADSLPPSLSFKTSDPEHIPAEDGYFDFVVAWSVFQHVAEPVLLLKEINRITQPGGTFVLQLWPFFFSEHGSYLSDWFPEGFAQLRYSREDMEAGVRASPKPTPEWSELMLHEYSQLNKITLDELQRAMLAAGMAVRRLEILSHPIRIPPSLSRYPISLLAISGVQLVALRC